MHKQGFVHTDLKPDNVLVSGDSQKIRLGDFGSAIKVPEDLPSVLNEYLVSRYYRAPEIILGLQQEANDIFAIDVWSAAVTLYELYTGKLLFDGRNNGELLHQIVDMCGRPNAKLLKKATQQ